MINYEQLKADDPAGSLESAYTILRKLTVAVVYEERLINERTIIATLGPIEGELFLSTLATLGQTNSLIARIVEWLKPGANMGIDIVNIDTQNSLKALASEGLKLTSIEAIIKLAIKDELKYPGLRMGNIVYVRRT